LRQRALLAIGLAGSPRLLICDEPTTALDVTIQAQVLETLRRLQREQELAIIFITHDLGVVAQLCSRVLVMYAGRIVEQAPSAQFFERPLHPYSQGLLASLPGRQVARRSRGAGEASSAEGERKALYSIPGSPPRPDQFPQGCRFSPRCPHATQHCRDDYPEWQADGPQLAACWRARELAGLQCGPGAD
jgi:oligopeptide/dipeptide ABC transporter ATP-binding protein